MDDTRKQIIRSLQRRRQSLQMPLQALAKRANLGSATVQRALCGGPNVRLDTLVALVHSLGMRINVNVVEAESRQEVLEEQSKRKAHRLAGMTQASAGLEGQAVSEDVRQDVEADYVHELMAGSKMRLWST